MTLSTEKTLKVKGSAVMAKKVKELALIMGLVTLIGLSPTIVKAESIEASMGNEAKIEEAYQEYIKIYPFANKLTPEDAKKMKDLFVEAANAYESGQLEEGNIKYKAINDLLRRYEMDFNLTLEFSKLSDMIQRSGIRNLSKEDQAYLQSLYLKTQNAYTSKNAKLYDELSKQLQTRLEGAAFYTRPYLSKQDKTLIQNLVKDWEKYSYIDHPKRYAAYYTKIANIIQKYEAQDKMYNLSNFVIDVQKTTSIGKADLKELNALIKNIGEAIAKKDYLRAQTYEFEFDNLMRKHQSKLFIESQMKNIERLMAEYNMSVETKEKLIQLIKAIDLLEIDGKTEQASAKWNEYDFLIEEIMTGKIK